MSLIAELLDGAEHHATRVAIVDGKGRSFTYRELIDLSAALAASWQARGIVEGDRVLVCMGVGFRLYAGLLALWRLGAVAVFPEPALGLFGLRHAAAVTTPKAWLADGWYRWLKPFLPELRRIRVSLPAVNPVIPAQAGTQQRVPDDLPDDAPALISFTSGSTGRPKAIVRSHRLLAAQNAAIARFLRPAGGPTVDLVAFPVFVLAELALGNVSVLPDWKLSRPDAVAADHLARLIEQRHVTRVLVPPALLPPLIAGPTPNLDAVFTGGGPVFPDVLQRLAAALPNAAITAVYGSTEAEPIAHISVSDIGPDDWSAMREGRGLLAGTPAPEATVAILDDEIVVTGDHVNKGYLDPAQDASTKLRRDGIVWHRTGDAGRLDERGRLWLLGRLGAKAGGHFPFSVELAARSWPGVRVAALVEHDGRAVIALEGDVSNLARWQEEANKLGDLSVRVVRRIPLDRRHRSKVDYGALRRLL